jgi:hypothetical protein
MATTTAAVYPTLSDLMEIIQDDNNEGFCLACGAHADCVDPDTRKGECEVCGAHRVFGAEELLIMGQYIADEG